MTQLPPPHEPGRVPYDHPLSVTPPEYPADLLRMTVRDFLIICARKGTQCEAFGFEAPPPMGMVFIACARGEWGKWLSATIQKRAKEPGRFGGVMYKSDEYDQKEHRAAEGPTTELELEELETWRKLGRRVMAGEVGWEPTRMNIKNLLRQYDQVKGV
jgi:hypothetical protein